jgi:hypothetical protein
MYVLLSVVYSVFSFVDISVFYAVMGKNDNVFLCNRIQIVVVVCVCIYIKGRQTCKVTVGAFLWQVDRDPQFSGFSLLATTFCMLKAITEGVYEVHCCHPFTLSRRGGEFREFVLFSNSYSNCSVSLTFGFVYFLSFSLAILYHRNTGNDYSASNSNCSKLG